MKVDPELVRLPISDAHCAGIFHNCSGSWFSAYAYRDPWERSTSRIALFSTAKFVVPKTIGMVNMTKPVVGPQRRTWN